MQTVISLNLGHMISLISCMFCMLPVEMSISWALQLSRLCLAELHLSWTRLISFTASLSTSGSLRRSTCSCCTRRSSRGACSMREELVLTFLDREQLTGLFVINKNSIVSWINSRQHLRWSIRLTSDLIDLLGSMSVFFDASLVWKKSTSSTSSSSSLPTEHLSSGILFFRFCYRFISWRTIKVKQHVFYTIISTLAACTKELRSTASVDLKDDTEASSSAPLEVQIMLDDDDLFWGVYVVSIFFAMATLLLISHCLALRSSLTGD